MGVGRGGLGLARGARQDAGAEQGPRHDLGGTLGTGHVGAQRGGRGLKNRPNASRAGATGDRVCAGGTSTTRPVMQHVGPRHPTHARAGGAAAGVPEEGGGRGGQVEGRRPPPPRQTPRLVAGASPAAAAAPLLPRGDSPGNAAGVVGGWRMGVWGGGGVGGGSGGVRHSDVLEAPPAVKQGPAVVHAAGHFGNGEAPQRRVRQATAAAGLAWHAQSGTPARRSRRPPTPAPLLTRRCAAPCQSTAQARLCRSRVRRGWHPRLAATRGSFVGGWKRCRVAKRLTLSLPDRLSCRGPLL